MRTSCLIITLGCLLLVAACEPSIDRRYLESSLGKPLELPPDLSGFETESSFDLPGSFSGSDPSVRNKVPVLAKVDSLQLQGSGDLYWLSVEEPVDNLYQQVKNFWAFEGYGLVVDEPVIGVMQTEWIYTEEGATPKDPAWWESLFASDDLSAAQDQFHTRIERDPDGKTSRIYFAHRGTEYQYELRIGDQFSDDLDNDFQFRGSEPELEVEMLSRLMVYLGLQQEAVDAQKEKVELFKPRARLEFDSDEKSPFMLMIDPYHIAWNRVHQTLLRTNFEIELAEFKSGLFEEGIFIVKAEVVETEEDKGFFSFGSGDDIKTRRFTLVLSEENHEITRVIMEDEKGNFDVSPEGSEFITMLYEQVK